jgi:adenylate kinase
MALNTKIIILVGPPGSGKGTQSELLAERLNLNIVHLSQVIREKFKNDPDNPDVIESKRAYQEGRLTKGKVIAMWVGAKIKEMGKEYVSQGIILDGAARTIDEAKNSIKLFNEIVGKDKIKVFFINISPKETLKRNLKRIVCQKCLKPINPKLIGKIDKCPYCGGKLGKSLPTIKYLREEGLVIDINGEQPIEDVYQDIVKKLT